MLGSLASLAGRLSALTSYFSLAYLVGFLPVVVLVYSLMPQKTRKYVLLLASYGFFWCISGGLALYLLLCTLSIFTVGHLLGCLQARRDGAVKAAEKPQRKAIKKAYQTWQRLVVLWTALVFIGMLLMLKYGGFFADNINRLLDRLSVGVTLQVPQYILPIGISFFTLQAMSYVFDVYRGVIAPEKNVFRLALFMSFFPQIVEGPICRYRQTAEQLWQVKGIQFAHLTQGTERILFGLMKKLVVADRLNALIQEVFTHYDSYEGGVIALAAVCYTVQLYMDFSGTMDAVMGTAQIFGVVLPENFRRPFFSKTISEFWQRWHITLGAWFKDYVFYPLSMAQPMKRLTSAARKRIGNHFGPLLAGGIALFCVWFCNGLWHGAGWNYIFFGLYHFCLILGGSLISPWIKKGNQVLHISSESKVYQTLQRLRTAVLVVIGELFFRADGLQPGLAMFRRMITGFRFTTLDDALLVRLGVDRLDLLVVCAALALVLTVGILQERGIACRKALAKKPLAVHWAVIYGLILFVVVFGAYGPGYVPVDPIYANF